MTENEVIKLGNALMIEHNLIQNGWRFVMDNAVKRFGQCRYRERVISISRPLSAINEIANVKNTILHEIAHALAGSKAGHGMAWKMVCIRIGAKPERCFTSNDTAMPQMRYYAICGGCSKVWQRAKAVDNTLKRSCTCQRGIDWSKRKLLKYIDRRA